MAEDIRVDDNPAETRYEIFVDGDLAGFAQYEDDDGRRTLLHTLIEPAFEGRGLGSRLAAAVLDDIRAKGLTVLPLCPFIGGYIQRHPEYADLVRIS